MDHGAQLQGWGETEEEGILPHCLLLSPVENKSPHTRCMGHVRPRVGETMALHV